MTNAYREFLLEAQRYGSLFPYAAFAPYFDEATSKAAQVPPWRCARFLRQSPLEYLDELPSDDRSRLERVVELLKEHVREIRRGDLRS